MRMKAEFKLVGLSKPKSFTCHTEKGDIFWATSAMGQDRFNALFDYFKNDEDEKFAGKKVIVQHEGLYEDGTPIKPEVIEVIL